MSCAVWPNVPCSDRRAPALPPRASQVHEEAAAAATTTACTQFNGNMLFLWANGSEAD